MKPLYGFETEQIKRITFGNRSFPVEQKSLVDKHLDAKWDMHHSLLDGTFSLSKLMVVDAAVFPQPELQSQLIRHFHTGADEDMQDTEARSAAFGRVQTARAARETQSLRLDQDS
jgi:hypothetical protein